VSDALRDVGGEVIARLAVPKDHWEIAAQLEVMGIRDADARDDFACADTFDMARRIFAMYREGSFPEVFWVADAAPAISRIRRFLRHYFDGLLFALPVAVQASAMVLWGLGVWGSIRFDARTTTAMAIGVLASYMVTGGFAQTIVRRGLFYIFQEEEYLARLTVVRIWAISAAIVIGLLIPFALFNGLYAFLPWDMFGLVALYYVALSILWLNFALIYLTRRPYLFTAVFVVATAVAVVAVRVMHTPEIVANVAALLAANVASFTVSIALLNRSARARSVTRIASPPRLTILVYSTSQFFFYGALYNMFLFADRIAAWTSATGRADYLPYPVWVDGPYELGMDLALIVVVLLMGVVEHSTQRFSARLIKHQERVSSGSSEEFNREFVRFYWRRLLGLVAASVVALLIASAIFFLLRVHAVFPPFRSRLTSHLVTRVFVIAAIGYAFFMIALMNAVILLSLSRVGFVIRAISAGLVVNALIGFFCGRAIHYSLAVIGLLAGSIVFAAMSTFITHRVMRRLDYYYYSAY
jgi:hypothetical protein